jgi:hypothetical protein
VRLAPIEPNAQTAIRRDGHVHAVGGERVEVDQRCTALDGVRPLCDGREAVGLDTLWRILQQRDRVWLRGRPAQRGPTRHDGQAKEKKTANHRLEIT